MLNDASLTHSVPRAGRSQFVAWLALVAAVALMVILYLSLSLAISADPLLMPLDDTYIHFQYARQMAQGQPMVYHDGDPATSGGTSLIYPALLAVGYAAGFAGWALAYWALLVGVGAFLGCVWLVYLIGRAPFQSQAVPQQNAAASGHALLIALAFAVSGPFVWAALSGMETMLFVLAVLLTLYALQRDRLGLTVGAALLATLTRPEGVAVAGIAMLTLALRLSWPDSWRVRLGRVALLALPVVAVVIQPLINLLATGSVSSSGMQAKSHLYNASASFDQRLRDVLEFFARMWRELLTGESADWGTFVPWLLVVMAFAALLVGTVLAFRQRQITVSPVMLVWMLALTAGVATLDTAFWQFKRYQLPVMALLFPAAAWGSALQGAALARNFGRRWAQWAIPVIILVASLLTGFSFAQKYAVNVRVVHDQQVPMARWVRDNLPGNARVAVHDVGLMGYFSDHALYDVVGLTLPGPAESWRQGPGAIYEHMAHSDYRPGYFAIYPDVQGLRYLLNAGVMGEVLAEFPVDLPEDNVAAALDYQAVYAADWSNTRDIEQVAQTTTLDAIAGLELVDWIDVAHLESESAHDYAWWQEEHPSGFVTEVYRHYYHACGLEDQTGCMATDGGRVLTGGEEFTARVRPGEDVLLVTRVHGRSSAPLEIAINGEIVVRRVQPAVPGRWVEIVTVVTRDAIMDNQIRVRITTGGEYMPYYHWVYQGTFAVTAPPQTGPIATFGDTGAIQLRDVAVRHTAGKVALDLLWSGAAHESRDGIVFVHLYNSDQVDTEPVAQIVARPAGGVLPPANWLPGVIEDSHTLLLPDDLPPGEYVVAIGFFDAITGERYDVRSDELSVDDRRLFVGQITVEESSQ